MLLSAPDSLVVSIVKTNSLHGDEQSNLVKLPSTSNKSSAHGFGIDGLDSLKFTYKVFPWNISNLFLCLVFYSQIASIVFKLNLAVQVSWPLELIANAEAIKKYNQVILLNFCLIHM